MPLSDDKHLTAAVKGIAMSIVNNISRLSTELKSFIEKSKIKTNLQTAIDNVKDIGNQFTDGDNGDDSNTDHGAKIDAALQKVSAAITQLEGLLGKMADDGGAIQEKIKEIETNLGELNNIWKDEQDGRIKKKQKDAEDLMLELQD
ncbi:cyclase family protein, putative [Babesia ovata]|nr:cyclase family protein, putative [Babesia ovata]GBE63522.1 cyclase family protein, putative [Babesia ovata]